MWRLPGESKPSSKGVRYYVSDEQLQAFTALSPLQRLQWLDEARQFTLLAETPTTEARRAQLRRGKP